MRTHAARNTPRPVPRAPGAFREPDVVLLLAVPLVAFLIAGLFAAGRSLFPDEAAFLLNFSTGWRDLTRPLGLYSQAAPPLAVVTLSGLDALAAGSLPGMRLLLLGLTAAGLLGLAIFAVRQQNPLIALALALFASAQPVIIYATEIKPYILDGGIALALLALYLDQVRRPEPLHLPAFCLMALAAFGLAFSAAFVVAVMLAETVIWGRRRPGWRLWAAALLALGAVWALLYVTLFERILAVHLANNAVIYGETQLRAVLAGAGAPAQMMRSLAGCVPYLALPALLAVVLFAALRGRRQAAPAPIPQTPDLAAAVRLLILVAVLLVGLSLAGLYPLSSTHQLVYLTPFVCFALAALTLRFSRALPARTLAMAVAVALIPVSALNVAAAVHTRFERTDTVALVRFVQQSGTPRVAAWISFEPVLRYYEESMALPGIAVLGRLDAGTGFLPGRDDMVRALDADTQAVPQQAIRLMGARPVAVAYAHWLARRLPPGEATLITGTDLSADDVDILTEALKARGCLARTVFEGKGVRAIRADCAAAPTGQSPPAPG